MEAGIAHELQTKHLQLAESLEFLDQIKAHNDNSKFTQLPALNLERIRQALVLCENAHCQQRRRSGEPYALHPIAVARLLLRDCPDEDAIIAGLLHDTIEDTEVTAAQLSEEFSPLIARLVEGVTKLGVLRMQTRDFSIAGSYRKMMLAMSRDPRVLIIKLADRIHNMQTIDALPRGKQLRIAQETDVFFAPLAARIGMQQWRDTISDLVFRTLDPIGWQAVTGRLAQMKEKHQDVIAEMQQALSEIADSLSLPVSIVSRVKSPSSIWRKLRAQSQGRAFDFSTISDVTAIRLVINQEENQKTLFGCYQALGLLHLRYRAVPERFRDYISTPKENGYRTLHTTVFVRGHHRCEVQIRTRSMHWLAEYGMAAHWLYKLDPHSRERSAQAIENWIANVLDAYSDAGTDTLEGMTALKLTLDQDELVVFTPRGQPIALPIGATPVDFAYAIHTKQVGERYSSATVNGKPVSPMHRLQAYDEVEITTSDNPVPEESWLRLVKTARARAGIRRLLRPVQQARLIESGREILRQVFANYQREYSDEILQLAVLTFNQGTVERLLMAIATSTITPMKVFTVTYPEYRHAQGQVRAFMPLEASKDLALNTAPCCQPVPGEDIIGVLAEGRVIVAHRYNCPNLSQFMETPERLQPMAWPEEQQTGQLYPSRITLRLKNIAGTLAALTTIIGREGSNIIDIRMFERTSSTMNVTLELEIPHISVLERIFTALSNFDSASNITRGG